MVETKDGMLEYWNGGKMEPTGMVEWWNDGMMVAAQETAEEL
jgi:hypothetical protein